MNDWPVEKPQGPLVNTADHGATATPGSVTKRCGSTWTGTENVMPVAASAADRSLVGLSARVTNARVSSATNTDRRITDCVSKEVDVGALDGIAVKPARDDGSGRQIVKKRRSHGD